MSEEYNYSRVFVDGLGTPDEVKQLLLATGHYRSELLTLNADGVWIDVRRNKNTITADEPPWLGWPVTMEVYRDEDDEVSDATMAAVVRQLDQDLRAAGGQVFVAAEFLE